MLICFFLLTLEGFKKNSSALWHTYAISHANHTRKLSTPTSVGEVKETTFDEETDRGIKGVQSVHSQLLVRFKIGKDTSENNYM